MDAWPKGDDARGEPWARFVAAREDVADGDQDLRRAGLGRRSPPTAPSRRTTGSRRGSFLHEDRVQPDPTVGRLVFGVVAEVAVEDGHDLLAAYDVGGARYLNHAGGASVVDDGPEEVVAAPPARWWPLARRWPTTSARGPSRRCPPCPSATAG